MHDNGAAENALGADQLDKLVRDRALGVTLAVSLEVAKVTDVTLRVRRGSVGLAVRVDYANQSCVLIIHLFSIMGCVLTVRAGRGAAVGVVAVGVNVHTALSVGIVAGDVP